MKKIVTSGTLKPVSPEECALLSEKISTQMPHGYQDFICRYGSGILADYLQIHTPEQILCGPTSLESWYKDLAEDGWNWDEEEIDDSSVEEWIFFAHLSDGGALIFHPDEPDRIILLPTDSLVIKEISTSGLNEAIENLLDDPLATTGTWDFIAEGR